MSPLRPAAFVLALLGTAAAQEAPPPTASAPGGAAMVEASPAVYDALSAWAADGVEASLEDFLLDQVEDVADVQAFLSAYLGRAPQDPEGEGELPLADGGTFKVATQTPTTDGYGPTSVDCNCDVVTPRLFPGAWSLDDEGVEPRDIRQLTAQHPWIRQWPDKKLWTSMPQSRSPFEGEFSRLQVDGAAFRLGVYGARKDRNSINDDYYAGVETVAANAHYRYLQLCVEAAELTRSLDCNCDKVLQITGSFETEATFAGAVTNPSGIGSATQSYKGDMAYAVAAMSWEQPPATVGAVSLVQDIDMTWFPVARSWRKQIQHVDLAELMLDLVDLTALVMGADGVTLTDLPAVGSTLTDLINTLNSSVTTVQGGPRQIFESHSLDQTLHLRANIPRHVLYSSQARAEVEGQSGGTWLDAGATMAAIELRSQLAAVHVVPTRYNGWVDLEEEETPQMVAEGTCCNETMAHWILSTGFREDFERFGQTDPEALARAVLDSITPVAGDHGWSYLEPESDAFADGGAAGGLYFGEVQDLWVPRGLAMTENVCSDCEPPSADVSFVHLVPDQQTICWAESTVIHNANHAAFSALPQAQVHWFFDGNHVPQAAGQAQFVADVPGRYTARWEYTGDDGTPCALQQSLYIGLCDDDIDDGAWHGDNVHNPEFGGFWWDVDEDEDEADASITMEPVWD